MDAKIPSDILDLADKWADCMTSDTASLAEIRGQTRRAYTQGAMDERARYNGLPFETDPDAPAHPTEFDIRMIDQSRRLACLKCATRMMGDSIGGTSAQVLSDAQDFYNWVTMTEEQRAQAAAT